MRNGRGRWHRAYVQQVLDAGGGRPGAILEYLQVRNLDRLGEMARHDRNAAEALVRRYEDLTPTQLQNRAARGDATAQYVLDSPSRSVDGGGRGSSIDRADVGRASPLSEGAETPAARESALLDGTVGVLETDVPGLTGVDVAGSPRAHRPQILRFPESFGRHQISSAAEHHAEEELLNRLLHRMATNGVPASAMNGRTVRIAVDQRVCSSCGSGLATSSAHAGVLRQFAESHPGVRIEVADVPTGDLMVITSSSRGTVSTAHHRRGGHIDD